jgi:hypothetical protein
MRVLILRSLESEKLSKGESSVDEHLNSIIQALQEFYPRTDFFEVYESAIGVYYDYEDKSHPKFFQLNEIFDVLLVSPYAINSLDFFRGRKIALRTFVSIPAIWWYEHPELFSIETLVNVIRLMNSELVSFVVPNERVLDYLNRFSLLYLGASQINRIFVLPYTSKELFVNAHQSMTASEDTSDYIEIIDAGGPWEWTANKVFLEAFIQHVNSQESRLRFTFFLKPKTNPEHSEYQQSLIDLLNESPQSQNIRVLEWQTPNSLKKLLSNANYGISLSFSNIESYLSTRVRVLRYIENGMQIIITPESSWLSLINGVRVVEPNTEEFLKLFKELEKESTHNRSESFLNGYHTYVRKKTMVLFTAMAHSSSWPIYAKGEPKFSIGELVYRDKFLPPIRIESGVVTSLSMVDTALLLEVVKEAFRDPYMYSVMNEDREIFDLLLAGNFRHYSKSRINDSKFYEFQSVPDLIMLILNSSRFICRLVPQRLILKLRRRISDFKRK